VLNLTFHFLNKYRFNNAPTPARISEEALQKVLDHDYPGNVRELENVIERAVVMSQGGLITPEHIVFSEAPIPGTTSGPIDLEQAIRRGQSLPDIVAMVERRSLQFAMQETGGSRLAAARMLGLERKQLDAKLKEHELDGPADAAAG
jgi:DNA-binding NtrC family response regulator